MHARTFAWKCFTHVCVPFSKWTPAIHVNSKYTFKPVIQCWPDTRVILAQSALHFSVECQFICTFAHAWGKSVGDAIIRLLLFEEGAPYWILKVKIRNACTGAHHRAQLSWTQLRGARECSSIRRGKQRGALIASDVERGRWLRLRRYLLGASRLVERLNYSLRWRRNSVCSRDVFKPTVNISVHK